MDFMLTQWRLTARRFRLRFLRKGRSVWTVFFVYIIALAIFSFGGDRGLWTSLRLWNNCQNLDQNIRTLQREVADLRMQVDLFRNNDRTIEKFAREELRLAGEGEIHYIFE